MRAVVQRSGAAEVRVDGDVVGSIAGGLVVLLGIAATDDERDAGVMATKIAGLRVFPDAEGRMNLALNEVEGAVLLVSQFTLLADVRKGRRPSFVGAAVPETANRLVGLVGDHLTAAGITVATGRFGAMMEVDFVNEGPVTIVIDVNDGVVR